MSFRDFITKYPVYVPCKLSALRRIAREHGVDCSRTEACIALSAAGYELAEPDGRGYQVLPPKGRLPASTSSGWQS
jgi:hypothetical protein